MATHTNPAPVPHRKRVRFSADASSEPSVSDDSALIPTSTTEVSTDASNSDSDTESELSSSSEEPSDDSSSEEDSDGDVEMTDQEGRDRVVNLPANRGAKPSMKLDQEEMGPDIRSFLKDFLPQLKAANEELEAQKKAGTLKSLDTTEETDEGAPYIEMDLGLGVLEAKDPNAIDSSGDDSDDTEMETDRLGKLLGREKKDPAGIEVVHDARVS
ncbi:hypothetical protein ACN47E_009576 [Coniothyrium glycines]